MSKCRYCGIELSGIDDYRQREHRIACKNVSPEVRYIHSGIPQKGYPDKNRKPGALVVLEVCHHIKGKTREAKEPTNEKA